MKNRKLLGKLAILLAVIMMTTLFVFPAFAEDDDEHYIAGWRSFIPGGMSDRVMYYHLKHNVWGSDAVSQLEGKVSFYQEWMKWISDSRYLNEINIPGTHDSGMKDAEGLGIKGNYEDKARTQGLFIDEQLFWGIRYFDVRLYHKREYWKNGIKLEQWDDHENLWVLHGKNENAHYWGQNHNDHDTSLSEVLGWMKAFLKEHPSETVIIHLRPETEKDNQKDIIMERLVTILRNELLNQTNPYTKKSYLYTFERNKGYPRLGDCRGQVVVRCSNDYGLQKDSNSCISFDPEDKRFKDDYKEQDHYQWTATSKRDWAKEEYIDWWFNLPENSGLNADSHFSKLYNVWLSTVGNTDAIGIPKKSPKTTSESVNGDLFGEGGILRDTHMQYLGWVCTDYATNEISASIWKSNFYAENDCCTITVKSGRTGQDDITQYYAVKKGTIISIPSDTYNYDREAMNSYLIGWKTGDSVFHQPGTSFTVTEDVTFTGEWAPTLAVPLRIEWNDAYNADEIRPEKVTINYRTQSGGSGSVTLTAADALTSSETAEGETSGSQSEETLDTWEAQIPGDTNEVILDNTSNTWFNPAGPNGQGSDGERTYRYEKSGSEGTEWKFTFIHLHIMKTIPISGRVVWHDGDNKDGLRPERVIIKLLRDESSNVYVPVSETSDWTFRFGNLPLYDNGKKLNYRIIEAATEESDELPEYEVKYAEDGFDVINTHNPDSTIDMTKRPLIWDDDNDRDRVRPDSVTLSLYQDGAPQGTVRVQGPEWEYDFGKDYPEFSAGEKIPYRVESDTAEYTASLDMDSYNVAFQHTPITLELSGRILWEGDTPEERPESVTVRLLANGEEVASQAVKPSEYVSGEEGTDEGEADGDEPVDDEPGDWIWSFGEVYKYENGVEIEYSVTEDAITDYVTAFNKAAGEFLNTKQPVVVLELGEGHEACAEAYSRELDGSWVSGTRVMLYAAANQPFARPAANPELNGYSFENWYQLTDTGEIADAPFNFSTLITNSVTLKAMWTVTAPYVNAKGEAMESVAAQPVFGDTRTWSGGWYAVAEDIDISGRVNVTGSVNLILCDGKTLNVNNSGIGVKPGASLTIWAQEKRTGVLIAAGKSYDAGIGGEYKTGAGTVIIHGGMVNAEGGHNAAGIGGGYTGDSGTLIIDGGAVTAAGGDSGAGIGGGFSGDGNRITVSGGTVNATGGGGSGAGIGGGYKGNGGTITVSGGDVTASSIGAGNILAIGSASSSADITLTYEKNAYASIAADSYVGIVTLLKTFAAEDGEEIRAFEAGEYSDEASQDSVGMPDDLAGETLMSVFTVRFDSDGSDEVSPQIFLSTNTSKQAVRPVDPTKFKYAFMGWYPVTESGILAEDAFNFDTIITGDVSLKAKWDGSLIFILPKSMKTIAAGAFANTGAAVVEVQEGCASIGDGAFTGCANLQQIYVPKGCELLGNPFTGCALVSIYGAPDNDEAIAFCQAHEENCRFVPIGIEAVSP